MSIMNNIMSYNSSYINCDCEISCLTTFNIYILEHRINIHFYKHLMESFIPRVCCNIVKDYIDEIPYSWTLIQDKHAWINDRLYTTLGYVFFDEGHKDYDDGRCVIKRCGVMRVSSEYLYCTYHYNCSIKID
jgi:hypothetical protein